MAVAHDAATENASTTGTSPIAFNHIPAGTPRGVVVFIVQNGNATDTVTGVTYGGVTMADVTGAADTAGEPGRVDVYFLGSSVPTGTQSVSIAHNGTNVDRWVQVVTVTADANTEIATSGILQGDQADPQIALNTGATTAQRYAAVFSGFGVVTQLTNTAPTTNLDNHDFGAQTAKAVRETTPASGSVTVGWTGSSEDVAMVAVAVREVAGGTTVTVDTVGAFTFAGQTVNTPITVTAQVTTLGAVSLAGQSVGAIISSPVTAGALTLAGQTVGAVIPGPAPTFDAATESVHLSADVDDPHEFTHTPSGTPTGVVVFVAHGDTSTDKVTGVTYGGTAMTRHQSVTDGGISEPGRSYVYVLSTSVPTGAQTVSVDLTGSATDVWIVAVTLAGGASTEVVDSDAAGAFAADPQVTLQYGGRGAMALAGIFSGHSVVTNLAPLSGVSLIHDHDFGVRVARVDRQTTGGTADFTIGYTAAADEYALVAVAIGTIAAAGGGTTVTVDTVGTLSFAGQTVGIATAYGTTPGAVTLVGQTVGLATAHAIAPGVLTLTGQTVNANAGANVTVTIDTLGALSLAGQTVGALVTVRATVTVLGAFTVAGQTVNTPLTVRATVTTLGSLSLTGQTVNVAAGAGIVPGALTLAGQTVGAILSVPVTAGSASLQGQTVGAVQAIPVTAGAVSLTGQAVGATVSVTVAPGAVALAGQGVPSVTSLTVAPGAVTLEGRTVGAIVASGAAVFPGELLLAGQPVALALSLPVVPGALTSAGQTLTVGVLTTVTAGQLALAGQAVAYRLLMTLQPGAVTFGRGQVRLQRGTLTISREGPKDGAAGSGAVETVSREGPKAGGAASGDALIVSRKGP